MDFINEKPDKDPQGATDDAKEQRHKEAAMYITVGYRREFPWSPTSMPEVPTVRVNPQQFRGEWWVQVSRRSPRYIHTKLDIGIEETNAGIGIPASRILVRYRTKKMLDCVSLVRYWTVFGIVIFFQSGTGLTGCRTVQHSGISIYMSMDIDIDMKH
jgi:hypothetical protein